MNAPASILLIRLSSLGDILHAFPAYRSLRETYPTARIDWLVESRMSFLLSVVPALDDILEIDTRLLRDRFWQRNPWIQTCRVLKGLRGRKYDLSIDFQGLLKTGVLSRLSGAQLRVGFAGELVRERPAHLFYNRRVASPSKDAHVVDLNLALARSAGGHQVPLTMDLEPSQQDTQAVTRRLEQDDLRRFVIVNPGGGWPTKRWSPSRFGELASKIGTDLGLPVVVTTAPGEEDLFREIAAQHRKPELLFDYRLPFLQLIPLIKRSSCLVAGDTGPFHLACVLGARVVGILGPTDPKRNGPWAEGEEAVYQTLPCSFCYGRTCPTRNECMDIPVQDVFAAVERRISRAN